MRAPTYEVGGLTVGQLDRRLNPVNGCAHRESDIPEDPRRQAVSGQRLTRDDPA